MKHEVKINKDDNAHLELYTREARKSARKRKERNNWLKFWFISVCTILIMVWLWNTPVEADEELTSELNALEQLIEEVPEMIEYIEEEKTDYEKLMEEWEKLHEEKVKQYKEVEEQAFEFIIQFEWYHDKPYWDHKQWSCGYGMACSQYTTWITKEKSKILVMERIQNIRERYALYEYDDNIEVAIISFTYNIWRPPFGMDWYIQNWHINALKNTMRRYVHAGDKVLWGLVKRRNAECNLF